MLSRSKVFVLQALSTNAILQILHRARSTPCGLGAWDIRISDEALNLIAGHANGDARAALNTLELAVAISRNTPHSPSRSSSSANTPISG